MTTISQIKQRNESLGHHWFEPATLRFFRSRVGETVYEGPGGTYFVSSEQFVDSLGHAHDRLYTVRRFNEDGSIDTVGAFNRFSRAEAIRGARTMAATQPAPGVAPQ